jgi:hypothetical protein
VKLSIKYGFDLLMEVIKKRLPEETVSDVVARLEDILVEKQQRQGLVQEKEQLKEALRQSQEKQKATEELILQQTTEK